jgi:hypothetical protein
VFLDAAVPEALRPTVSQRALQVALIWGADKLVDVQQVGAAEEQRSRRAQALPFTDELVAPRRRPLFQLLRSGEHVLLVPDGSSLRIGRGDEWLDLPALLARGEASPVEVPVRGARYVLGLHERVEMTAAELQVVGRYLRPERARRTPLGERLDTAFLSRLIMVLLAGICLLGMFHLSSQLGSETEEAFTIHRPDWNPVRVTEPPPPQRLTGGLASSQSPEGRPPAHHDPDPRIAVAPNHQPTKHDRDLKKVNQLLAALDDLPAVSSALSAPLSNAIQGIQAQPGGQIASADDGGIGRGSRGDGPGGPGPLGPDMIGNPFGHGPGGVGRDPIGDIRIPKGKPTHLPLPGGPIMTSDGLAKEVVERIVRRHWNEIRYCYEKELSHDPNLAGKITVDFVIGPIGDVVKAETGESTLGSAAVASCVTANVQRWQFPPPAGGGIVDVHYPFLFQAK